VNPAQRAAVKGRATRDAILHEAVDASSELGLDGLSIGTLATRLGMSKSGLYAHFTSKEDLQCAVLDAAAEQFAATVLAPAFRAPRGRPRLESLVDFWLRWENEGHSGGCPFLAAAAEFDDRPGPVRNKIAFYLDAQSDAIRRAAQIAIDEGHFAPGLDTEQFAFEYWGLLLAYQQFERLLDKADAEQRARTSLAALFDRAAAH
jgi:AcrR family transcriptional regulator